MNVARTMYLVLASAPIVLASCTATGRQVGVVFAQVATAAILQTAPYYDGSGGRAERGGPDPEFVCTTSEGEAIRLRALGQETARAACENRRQGAKWCNCVSASTGDGNRSSGGNRPPSRIDLDDEPIP